MNTIRTAMAAQINASRNYSIEPEEEGLVMFGGPIAQVKECKLDSNGMVAGLELTLGSICPEQTKRPYCPECGHHDVSIDAVGEWCTVANDWVLKDTYNSGGCCECGASELKRFDVMTDAEHTAHWQAKLDEKGKELALSVDKDQGVLYRTEQLPNGGVKLFLKLTEKGKLSFAKEMGLPSANMGSFAAISIGD
ncbi:hypothetical protein RG2014_019 [Delftia phage RG-2014]|uniref:Uncharacterized protein n=1 Tax=Delftia phage RG-2014 TaxID=1563661 RepID=A0A097PAL8_9CAUD|nr:hypothetical protein RG2014_019 [Delftia phage RG-2014]AIU44273.2 hypothetical protein RG2014_019 [Delftia phage RG-2014]